MRNVSAGIFLRSGVSAQMNFQVNVNGPACIPAGIESRKLGNALLVRQLDALQ
jgi:hypothetical protein